MIEKIKKNKVKILAGFLIASEAVAICFLGQKAKKAESRCNILEGEKKNLEDMNKGLTREVKNLAYQLGKKS